MEGLRTAFQFPLGSRWCSDVVGSRTMRCRMSNFNSPWELDGVRTELLNHPQAFALFNFQFPVGIRWCSDVKCPHCGAIHEEFQFPLGIRWCSDAFDTAVDHNWGWVFQFPLGIRWCSDGQDDTEAPFTWEFQFPLGIRWCSDRGNNGPTANTHTLSIPCGN